MAKSLFTIPSNIHTCSERINLRIIFYVDRQTKVLAMPVFIFQHIVPGIIDTKSYSENKLIVKNLGEYF